MEFYENATVLIDIDFLPILNDDLGRLRPADVGERGSAIEAKGNVPRQRCERDTIGIESFRILPGAPLLPRAPLRHRNLEFCLGDVVLLIGCPGRVILQCEPPTGMEPAGIAGTLDHHTMQRDRLHMNIRQLIACCRINVGYRVFIYLVIVMFGMTTRLHRLCSEIGRRGKKIIVSVRDFPGLEEHAIRPLPNMIFDCLHAGLLVDERD